MKLNEILLQETFINLFKPKDKKLYVDAVWDILTNSYKSIGGLKGSGLESKASIMSKIPMWKLWKDKDGKVKAVILYKNSGGRKSIAAGTDGPKIGKDKLLEMIRADMKRSMGEKSGKLLAFIERNYPSLIKDYAIPSKDVAEILNREITIIDKFRYSRTIGGSEITKMLLGTPGKTII